MSPITGVASGLFGCRFIPRCGWYGQSAFNSPAVLQSTGNCLIRQSSSTRPLGDAQRFTTMSQETIAASIAHLLTMGCPYAILRIISARIISSLKAMPRSWSRAHICEEILEAVDPFLAHRDAAATVVLKRRMVWIGAPNDHAAPHVVFRRFIHAVTEQALPEHAAATFRRSVPQSRAADEYFSSANTTTAPQHDSTGAEVGWLDRCQTPRHKASQVVLHVPVSSMFHLAIIGAPCL